MLNYLIIILLISNYFCVFYILLSEASCDEKDRVINTKWELILLLIPFSLLVILVLGCLIVTFENICQYLKKFMSTAEITTVTHKDMRLPIELKKYGFELVSDNQLEEIYVNKEIKKKVKVEFLYQHVQADTVEIVMSHLEKLGWIKWTNTK